MGKVGESYTTHDMSLMFLYKNDMSLMFLYKNPCGEKLRNRYNSCIDIASLKPIMRNLESKTHIEKRVQCDACDGLCFKRMLPLKLANL